MNKIKIIIDDKIPFIKGRLESLQEEGISFDITYAAPETISREMVADADALIVRTRTRCDENLLKDSSVRLVVTATIGTDHIDIPWCESQGIKVCNAAGCNAPGVAQYVWSSLLRLGFDPSRHTLGVVGVGHVGSIVADWGQHLGAKILACDPPKKRAGFSDYDYRPLRQLLEECDAVTLHTPLSRTGEDATFHMIGETELKMMKPDAILINSSRGPVVDNEAWAASLKAGQGRAVVDVWEGEPSIRTDLLEEATIATPHIAGYSAEGKQRATRMALEAVADFFKVIIPTEDLAGDYEAPGDKFPADAAERITESYNPFTDDKALRKAPCNFEKLRSNYNFRKEAKLKGL